ncbi:hypothetical protein SVIOM342S_10526 [Streptomyces violaceorubidus]
MSSAKASAAARPRRTPAATATAPASAAGHHHSASTRYPTPQAHRRADAVNLDGGPPGVRQRVPSGARSHRLRPGGCQIQPLSAPQPLCGCGQAVTRPEGVAGRCSRLIRSRSAYRRSAMSASRLGVVRSLDPGPARRHQRGAKGRVGRTPAARPAVGEVPQHRPVRLRAPEQLHARAQGLGGRAGHRGTGQHTRRHQDDGAGAAGHGGVGNRVEPGPQVLDVGPVLVTEDHGRGEDGEEEQPGQGQRGQPPFGDPAAQRAEEAAGHRRGTVRSGCSKIRQPGCGSSSVGASTRPQRPRGQASTCSGGWSRPATGSRWKPGVSGVGVVR